MEQPFKDVYVVPSYGKKEALIKWEIDPTFETGNFIVQKSGNGITHWETIGSDVGINEFLDENFVVPNKTQQTFYRVIIQYNKQRYTSESVSTFDKLERMEFGALHRMMQLEHFRMFNARNGIKVVIFKQKIAGEPCNCSDSETEQQLGSSMCESCYGTGLKDGFDDPVFTFAEIQKQQEQIKYDQKGSGADDQVVKAFRLVAYPELRKGDLIVNPRTDERFLVESVQAYKFLGEVPFVYEIQALHLRRNDIRYKLLITDK